MTCSVPHPCRMVIARSHNALAIGRKHRSVEPRGDPLLRVGVQADQLLSSLGIPHSRRIVSARRHHALAIAGKHRIA